MTHEIILHNYAASPFSEKVRRVFSMKRLAWRSVDVPIMLPKPDLLPLTGGYRRTPVMQIGADIFCDTQIIIRELEWRYPDPTVMPHGKGFPYGLAFWTDRLFFLASVPIVFGEIGHLVSEAFKKDREAMSPRGFSAETMAKAAPFMRDQWRAHAGFIAEQLADGRAFVEGEAATVADAHCHMNLWFLKETVPQIAEALLEEFPLLESWYERVAAIGHGTMTPMDSKEALAIARATEPDAAAREDPFDSCGGKPGDCVTVAAEDYGCDPVEGRIVFANAREIAIARHDAQVGRVTVHFPRAGFALSAVA